MSKAKGALQPESPTFYKSISRADVITYMARGTPRRGRTLVEGELETQAVSPVSGRRAEARKSRPVPCLLAGADLSTWGEAELLEKIRHDVTDAIRRLCLQYHRPALLLSGGLDSTLLLCLMKQLGTDVACYVVRHTATRTSLDVRHALDVSKALGASCTVVEVDDRRFAEALDMLHSRCRTPLTCWSAVNQFVATMSAAGDGRDVVVSGLGGDELFGGYHKIGRYAWRFANLQRELGSDAAWRVLLGEPSAARTRNLYVGQCCPFPSAMMRALFPSHFRIEDVEQDVVGLFRESKLQVPWASYVSLILRLEAEFRTARLLRPDMDLATELGGLVTEYPLFDGNLVAEMAHLPLTYRYTYAASPKLKIRPPTHCVDKHGLRLAFQDLVPASVQSRQRSAFSVPTRPWWYAINRQGDVRKLICEASIWKTLDTDMKSLARVVNHPLTGDHWGWPFRLWVLYQLCRWSEAL